MAFKNQTENLDGKYPYLFVKQVNFSLEKQNSPTSGFSEKAKAFSIDALLCTDRFKEPENEQKVITSCNLFHQQTKPKAKINRDFKTSPYEKNNTIKVKRENGLQTDSYLSLKMEPSSERPSCDFMKKNPKMEEGYRPTPFSPMMTGWFIRPDEVYSPLSSQGTPVGLKSLYPSPNSLENLHDNSYYCHFTTPDSKNNQMIYTDKYYTPTGNFSRNEGRKSMSTIRRHDRQHPYLSARKIELNSPIYSQKINTDSLKLKADKAKRHRTAFTTHQLQVLESEFEKQQYMVGDERVALAENLDLSVSQVKVWFQNRRIKWRKEQLEKGTL